MHLNGEVESAPKTYDGRFPRAGCVSHIEVRDAGWRATTGGTKNGVLIIDTRHPK